MPRALEQEIDELVAHRHFPHVYLQVEVDGFEEGSCKAGGGGGRRGRRQVDERRLGDAVVKPQLSFEQRSVFLAAEQQTALGSRHQENVVIPKRHAVDNQHEAVVEPVSGNLQVAAQLAFSLAVGGVAGETGEHPAPAGELDPSLRKGVARVDVDETETDFLELQLPVHLRIRAEAGGRPGRSGRARPGSRGPAPGRRR